MKVILSNLKNIGNGSLMDGYRCVSTLADTEVEQPLYMI